MTKHTTYKNDVAFLTKIDKKVHFVKICTDKWGRESLHDSYHDEKKITIPEIKEVINITKRRELPFYPINTKSGFAVGFEVAKIEYEMRACGSYLKFLEAQLPKGYNFKTLSKVFLSQRNLELIKQFDLDPIHSERYHYDY